jgi:hypothetical protein
MTFVQPYDPDAGQDKVGYAQPYDPDAATLVKQAIALQGIYNESYPAYLMGIGPHPANVDPLGGLAAGGEDVTVWGSAFIGTTAVDFGGVAATNVQVLGPREISCITPAHAAGVVDVTVTTPAGTGTLPGGFTYNGLTRSRTRASSQPAPAPEPAPEPESPTEPV